MRCPNCQNEVREGAVFCGSCGAAIPAAAAAAESAPPQPPAPAPQPVVPQPAAYASPQPDAENPGQAEYERQMAEYQRKQAEYEAQKAAYEQYQQQAAGQTAQMPPAVAPAAQYTQAGQVAPAGYGQPVPAPKKKTGLIIGIVVGVLVLIGALAVGGLLVARGALEGALEDTGAEVEAPVTDDGSTDVPVEAPTAAGAATAEEAVRSALAAEGLGDWVQQLYKEDDASAVYWAGPPNSEWVSEVTVLKGADGTWSLGGIEALQFGGDVPMAPADEAVAVVTDFLVAIQEDRADDAHDLTIEPFSLDGASASYSNGQFTAFEILSAEEQSDGSVWVETSETWYGSTATQWYYVVPTEAGYRISNLEVR
ncbi:MAG: zinc-ribbon domain-containing protein [Actinomycetota bacterium]